MEPGVGALAAAGPQKEGSEWEKEENQEEEGEEGPESVSKRWVLE